VPGGQLLLELSVPAEVTHGPACNDAEHPTRWDPIPRRGAEGKSSPPCGQNPWISLSRCCCPSDGMTSMSTVRSFGLRRMRTSCGGTFATKPS
jgi:hypothetical protein